MATEFWAKEFDGGGQPSAAAIVAGMKGKEPVNFDTAARDLVREGHDVVVYEYDDLFAHGDPNELPALIEAISIDFELRTADHARKRYAGYSLGAGIAYNLQKRTAAETDTGLIVSGGTQAAENLFENPVFKMLGLPQRFRKNGYDRPDVEALWSDMQRPPITPFVVAFGGLDVVVSYRQSLKMRKLWTSMGVPLSAITRPFTGHEGMKRWFNDNVPTMLERAKALETNTH